LLSSAKIGSVKLIVMAGLVSGHHHTYWACTVKYLITYLYVAPGRFCLYAGRQKKRHWDRWRRHARGRLAQPRRDRRRLGGARPRAGAADREIPRRRRGEAAIAAALV